jgi:hypothetical protein
VQTTRLDKTVPQLVKHAYPRDLLLAYNTWSHSGQGGQNPDLFNGIYNLGVVIGQPKRGIVVAEFRTIGPLASGESAQYVLKRQDVNGEVFELFDVTIDSSDTPGGSNQVVDMLVGLGAMPVVVGDVLFIEATYVEGGGPNNPIIAIVVQAE